MPRIINAIEAIFKKLTGWWKNIIPTMLTNKIPKAPQIAYATLISMVLSANDKNEKQIT